MARVKTSKVTAKDVARVAGVSQATVSYVINDTPSQRISPDTRDRVLSAVAELGYTPSAAARALRKGSSDVVLLAMPNLPIGPTIASLIDRLEDDLESTGLSLITRRISDRHPLDSLWRQISPAAVVAWTEVPPQLERDMTASGIFVAQTLWAPRSGEATLTVPQHLIGRLQAEHLAVAGHSSIGYAAPADARVEGFLRLRLDGVRTSCVELGLDLPVVQFVPLDVASAADAVRAWRAASPPVTGVCAYNDEVAFAVLAGMRELGLTAPTDMAVIGVDNIALAPFASPPLTSIDQNEEILADHLAALIRAGIAGEPLPAMPRSESVSVIVRESA